jgi:hypothetical protein
MGHELMTGMLWAGAMMVAVPLAIGIGVLVLVLRRRGRGDKRLPDSGT